jgi:hypothetical protein
VNWKSAGTAGFVRAPSGRRSIVNGETPGFGGPFPETSFENDFVRIFGIKSKLRDSFRSWTTFQAD